MDGALSTSIRVSAFLFLSLSLSYIQKTAGPQAFLKSWLSLLEYS